MRKSEREVRGQAGDEGEQEAGEWWGRDMQEGHAADGGGE